MSVRAMLMAAAGAQASAAYRYWRIYIQATNGANYTSIMEIQYRASISGADMTSPSTPTLASSTLSSFSAALAVDNSTAYFDGWSSYPGADGIAGAMHAWHRVDLGSPQSVAEIAFFTSDNPSLSPRNFIVQGSADGINFVDVKSFSGITHSAYSWKTFDL